MLATGYLGPAIGDGGFTLRTIRLSTRKTKLGICPATACRNPGPNSCIRFMPASLPTVEPMSPIGLGFERAQYGREALCAATDVNTLTM